MKQIISIFLSLLVLISSMGITFSTHFCMGRAVDNELMIGIHELNCGMMDLDSSCEAEVTGPEFMAPDCCDNEFLSIEIENDYQIATEQISLQSQFLLAFTYTFLFDLQKNVTPKVAFADNHPPPLEQDYQSLYQSFLL